MDVRGQLGWGVVAATNCRFVDWDPAHPDRTAWRANEFKLNGCLLRRQLWIDMNASESAAAPPLRLTASASEWHLSFAQEPGLRLSARAGTHSAVNMSGCTFRNRGNAAPSSNAMILCDTTSGVIGFSGAGNTFDARFVHDAGGHCIEYSSAGPSFSDTPERVGTPFLSAFGVQQRLGG